MTDLSSPEIIRSQTEERLALFHAGTVVETDNGLFEVNADEAIIINAIADKGRISTADMLKDEKWRPDASYDARAARYKRSAKALTRITVGEPPEPLIDKQGVTLSLRPEVIIIADNLDTLSEVPADRKAPRLAKTTLAESPKKSVINLNGRGTKTTRKSSFAAPKEKKEDPEEDIIRIYLNQIGQFPLLTKEQEIKLAKDIEAMSAAKTELELAIESKKRLSPNRQKELQKIIAKGEKSEELFVNSNLRLAVSIAKKYQGSGMPLMDLIQFGSIGVMTAVEKFDWRKGFKFSTYATWWIRQSISRGISNTNAIIRRPVQIGDGEFRLTKATSRFYNDNGRSPTVTELAELLNVSEENIVMLQNIPRVVTSLNTLIDPEGSTELGDLIPDDVIAPTDIQGEMSVVGEQIRKFLDILNEQQQIVIYYRFGLDGNGARSLQEVGDIIGKTRERVRQIEAAGLQKIRDHAQSQDARALLQR